MSGRFHDGAGEPGKLCRCANAAATTDPTGEFETHGQDAGAQPELVQQLGDQLGDPLRRLGLAVGDLAEDPNVSGS